MLFTGEHEHTIDAKQRVAIPSDIRASVRPDVHGEGWYAVPGQNGAIWLWPTLTFEAMAAAMMDPSLLPEDEVMEFEDYFFSQAARLEVDSAGRVRLPDRLLKGAGIKKAVTVLGVKDHLELRDPEDWAARLAEKRAKQGELMMRARTAMARNRAMAAGAGEGRTE